ncbi:MAG TPA: SAF domain-containing protein [Acidimicrobiales bacterium]|nr:SAF domain-containing protein [Acidimicrobiales bacterium]
MKGTNAVLERARAAERDDASSRTTAGKVGRHRQGPPGRAVVGGLLIAVAAVGAFVVATPKGRPSSPYVIAARAIDPGAAITTSDLTTAQLDLPRELADHAFTQSQDLVGSIARSPLAPGELVQRGAVGTTRAAAFEVSLSLDADRALDGRAAPGERVAVLATYGTGADAVTLTVAPSALVERVSKPSGLAVGTAIVVTLGLSEEVDTQAVVHAARAGQLTLVRTDSATPDLTYQPPVAEPAAESAP